MKRFTMQDSSGDYDWMFTNAPYDPNMSPDDVEKWISSLIDIEIESYRSDLEQRAESLTYPRFGYTTADIYETPAEWLAAKIEELEEDIETERGNMRQEIAQWLEREAAKRSPARFRNVAEEYGGDEIATVQDYYDLNPTGQFVIDGDELREYDDDCPLTDSAGRRYRVVGRRIGAEHDYIGEPPRN